MMHTNVLIKGNFAVFFPTTTHRDMTKFNKFKIPPKSHSSPKIRAINSIYTPTPL